MQRFSIKSGVRILKYATATMFLAVAFVLYSCDKTYKVVYTPLNSHYYAPKYRGDFLKVKPREVNSIMLCIIFFIIDHTTKYEPREKEYHYLRIMVFDEKKDKEIFLSQRRKVLSIVDSVQYAVPEFLVLLADLELSLRYDWII